SQSTPPKGRVRSPLRAALPPGIQVTARLKATTIVAASTAKRREFQTALWPAASAPGNSVHARLTERIWNSGNPTAKRQSALVQTPQTQNHPGPSCWRKSLGETGPSMRGQGKSRRANQASRRIGASNNGKLNRNAPNGSRFAL